MPPVNNVANAAYGDEGRAVVDAASERVESPGHARRLHLYCGHLVKVPHEELLLFAEGIILNGVARENIFYMDLRGVTGVGPAGPKVRTPRVGLLYIAGMFEQMICRLLTCDVAHEKTFGGGFAIVGIMYVRRHHNVAAFGTLEGKGASRCSWALNSTSGADHNDVLRSKLANDALQ